MIHKIKLSSLFFLLVISINAQPVQEIAADLMNPQAAIYTHLNYLQEESYQPTKSAKAIYAPNKTEAEKVSIALKIKQILDGKGIYIDINLVPDESNYKDSTLKKHIYFLAPHEKRIYLEKYGDHWYYSSTSIELVDQILKEVYPWGNDLLRNILPDDLGEQKVFVLKNWQWLGIIILISLAIIGFKLLMKITSVIINFFFKREVLIQKLNKDLIKKIAKSFSLYFTFLWVSKLIPALLFKPLVSSYIIKATSILTVIFATILIVRIISFGMYFAKNLSEKTKTKLDEQLIPIIDKILKVLAVIIGAAFILRTLNVDLVAIFAGLSVGALALALAAQDTVKNFIGSITIFLDHPFEIGDYIAVSGVSGVVEEVGIRATRIRTLDQSLAYVPNAEIVNSNIDNFGLRSYRRWNTNIGILYSTNPDLIQNFIHELKNIVDDISEIENEKTIIRLNNLSSSSIDIYVDVFLNTTTYAEELACKEKVLFKFIYKANEMGVSFAYPTQTIHIESMPKTQ
jgi:MscS family membrane protein